MTDTYRIKDNRALQSKEVKRRNEAHIAHLRDNQRKNYIRIAGFKKQLEQVEKMADFQKRQLIDQINANYDAIEELEEQIYPLRMEKRDANNKERAKAHQVQCSKCGNWYHKKGIATHEKSCDGKGFEKTVIEIPTIERFDTSQVQFISDINTLKAQLEERNDELEKVQESFREAEIKITDAYEEKLAKRDERIKKLEKAKDESVAKYEKDLTEKRKAIADKDAEIQEAQTLLDNAQRIVIQRDKDIQSLKSQISDMAGTIATKDTQDKTIEELKERLSQKEATISDLQIKIDELDQLNEETKEEGEALDGSNISK